MSNPVDLIDRYIAAWNETDTGRRRELIARTWTEGATYLDPLMASEGHAGIDAMIGGVQAKFPGLRFSLTGKVDAFQDRVRFSWALAPAGGDALVKGTDFAVIAGDRLQAVTGFLDQVPAGAA
ncbi:MAG TPA: nuclear transport factor 2 family protein [Vineibacter sp.]|nr:nuclear transport factor 2 family protein [Vineibacter sp.]